jgi:hypothetical protein
MPLKNYTTTVSAMKSISQIQENLVKHGAKAVRIDYENQEPVGISFLVNIKGEDIPFRLPASVSKVEQILLKMRARKPEKWQSNYDQVLATIHKQASMTAWRTIKDWVDAQLAFIETEMVSLQEIFLPYMTGNDNKTLFEIIENRGYLLTGRIS